MTVSPIPKLVPAAQATVYLPSEFHTKSEAYAATRFKRVIRVGDGKGLTGGPSGQQWTEDECLAEADAILCRVARMPAEKITKAPKLLHIARNGAGYDTIDLPSCTSRGIVVTNCPGGNAFAVAELTVGLMLAIQRRIIESDRKVRRGERLKSIQLLAPGLRGNVIGLVGMGSIAWETAKILHFAFGCKILVLSPTSPVTRWTSKDPNGLDPIPHTRVDSLEELLPQVDILSLHCPLTTATRDMISTEQLKAMKSTAVVINTARGGMVDERALETALRTGEIAGAALDVWKSEPPNSETIGGLGELDNIIIVPHLGGSTDDATLEGCDQAIDQLADHLDGKEVRNRVA